MVEVGTLVTEDCSPESTPRIGTIVKVTQLELGCDSWQQDVQAIQRLDANCGRKYDPEQCDVIRPGKVFSVRWQSDPTRVTVHVAYNDCKGVATLNFGSNSVEVVR